MNGLYRKLVLVLGAIVLSCAQATMGLDAQMSCRAGKTKEAGKYAYCRQKAEATFLRTGNLDRYSEALVRCDDGLRRRWQKLEERAARVGTTCPDEPLDPNSLMGFIAAYCDAVESALGGEPLPTCGDGRVNAVGEHCDGADLDGYACADFGMAGALACTGSCDFDLTGCFDCETVGGIVVGGSCWFYGAHGQSCDTVCAAVGLAYDEATRTFAGSDGNTANCDAVLTALMVKGVPVDDDGSSDYQASANGRGCATLNWIGRCPESPPSSPYSCWWWDPSPTTSSASDPSTERACACK